MSSSHSPAHRSSWSVRLALLALLLPVVTILISQFADSGIRRNFADLTGFWQAVFVFTVFIVPVTALIFVVAKGWWRIAFVLLLVSLVSCPPPVDFDISMTKKESRKLDFSAHGSFCVGTEIYCNDILLGTVPMTITVDELMKKVPHWKPPEQVRYLGKVNLPLYTWIPWDGFIPERQKERRNLDPKRNVRELDESCEFWWNFRNQGATSLGSVTFHSMRRRDDMQSTYRMPNIISFVYPAKYPLFEILLDALVENDYKPSDDWLDFVATHGALLDDLFTDAGQPYHQHLEAVLDMIARRRYGLSDSPTTEECDRAIGRILEENRIKGFISTWKGKVWHSSVAKDFFGDSYYCRDKIVDRTIWQLGPNCEEPLIRRRRATEFGEQANAMRDREALTYLWGQHPFPGGFDESVCYYARHGRGFKELMSSSDPRLVPLLQTMLRDGRYDWEDTSKNVQLKCAALILVDNPMLEPTIRNYIAANTEVFRHREHVLHEILYDFVDCRIRRPEYGWDSEARKNLLDWVINSFPLSGNSKRNFAELTNSISFSFPLETTVNEDGPTIIEAKFIDWYNKNPETSIGDFFAQKIDSDDANETQNALFALALKIIRGRSPLNTERRQQVLRYAWKDALVRKWILKNLADPGFSWMVDTEGQHDSSVYYENSLSMNVPGLTLPLLFESREGKIRLREFRYTDELRRKTLPSFFVPFLAELTESRECVPMVDLLKRVETPEAEVLLEQWSRSSDKRLAEKAEPALKTLQNRLEFQRNKRELYAKILSGVIGPDDLLIPDKPFSWGTKGYDDVGK